MHPIPEMLNAPGEAIHCVVSSSFIKIVGPSFVVGFLAGEHVKDTQTNLHETRNRQETMDPIRFLVMAQRL